jgi:hypothetical protein
MLKDSLYLPIIIIIKRKIWNQANCLEEYYFGIVVTNTISNSHFTQHRDSE